jgi:hypothetical protein
LAERRIGSERDLLPERVIVVATTQIRARARAPQPRAERTMGSPVAGVLAAPAELEGGQATVVEVDPAALDAGAHVVVLEGTVVVVVDVVVVDVAVVVVVPTVPDGGPIPMFGVVPR